MYNISMDRVTTPTPAEMTSEEVGHNLTFSRSMVTSGLAEVAKRRMTPTSDWSGMGRTEHFVQFYESDAFIVNSVAEYLSHGIKAGESCIIAATRDHIDEIERVIGAFGQDVRAAADSGLYIPLEARSVLSKIMIDGLPDETFFLEILGPLMEKSSRKRGRIRIFGELVAVLLSEGNARAAIQLEALWNNLREKYPFSLFCAYPIDGFTGSEAAKYMAGVCSGHAQVIPGESYTSLTTPDERLRAIALLQQRGKQLEAEILELERRIKTRSI